MRLKLVAAGLASALLYHLALPGGPSPWLGWVALLPFFGALERWRPPGKRAATYLALPFGLLYASLTFHWLPELSPAADVTIPWIMLPAVVLWSFYLSLYPIAFVRILAALRDRWGLTPFLWAPVLWIVLEWLRGSGPLAFSWLHLSQSQAVPGGYLAPAGWVGGLGLSFLMVLAQAALSALLWRPAGTVSDGGARRLAGATLLATLAGLALMALPSHRLGSGSLRVAALQGNVSLEDKWEPRFRMENLRIFKELSEEAVAQGAQLLVWPETAFPVSIYYDRQAEQALRSVARQTGAYVFTGFQGLAMAPKGGYRYRNSAGLLAPNGAMEGLYHKERLLPFGEYIPLADFLFPGVEIDLGQSNFTPGEGTRVFDAAPLPLAPFICYEMGFAASVREAAADGARLLVNITNDGWFAHPLPLALHAALSPMRAAENGLPVLRCGNNGVTEILDGRGRRLGRLPLDVRDILIREVPRTERPSFYARHGAWSGIVLLALYGLLALRLSVNRAGKGRPPAA